MYIYKYYTYTCTYILQYIYSVYIHTVCIYDICVCMYVNMFIYVQNIYTHNVKRCSFPVIRSEEHSEIAKMSDASVREHPLPALAKSTLGRLRYSLSFLHYHTLPYAAFCGGSDPCCSSRAENQTKPRKHPRMPSASCCAAIYPPHTA